MQKTAKNLDFVLGTAQLGLAYGIANTTGKLSTEAVAEILTTAWDKGVRCFDTAQAYGKSEQLLGDYLQDKVAERPSIISKLCAGINVDDEHAVVESVRASLTNLKIDSLWGLMLHDESALEGWMRGNGRGLAALKREGLVERIGVSVYSPEIAILALKFPEVDIVQVPANVFDHRMARAGVFDLARKERKIVFVRSLFLQGLLFLTPAKARWIPDAERALELLAAFCGQNQISARQFAFDHVRWMGKDCRYVLGAETPEQVLSNAALFAEAPLEGYLHERWDSLWKEDNMELADPRRWPSFKKP